MRVVKGIVLLAFAGYVLRSLLKPSLYVLLDYANHWWQLLDRWNMLSKDHQDSWLRHHCRVDGVLAGIVLALADIVD